MSELLNFVENVMRFGLEGVNRFYGTYRGVVVRVDDPQQRGRVLVRVITLSDQDLSVWVDVETAGSGPSRGTFWPQAEGDRVLVRFDRGDPSRPQVYGGGWYPKEYLPGELSYGEDGTPRRYGWVTRGGHTVICDDTPDAERVRITWHRTASGDAYRTDPAASADRTDGETSYLAMEPNGSVNLATFAGQLLTLDPESEQAILVNSDGSSIQLFDGATQLQSADGTTVTLKDGQVTIITQDQINLTAQKVFVRAGSIFLGAAARFSAVLGERLIAWLNAHTHLAPSGGGTTGPASASVTGPAGPDILSPNVKL